MKIAGRTIDQNSPPYIVAEVGANHSGKLDTALRLIDAAKASGADAVKFQAYTADSITLDCDHPDFMIKEGPWRGWRLHDLYRKCETPYEWFPKLFDHARAAGVACFASVFDHAAVDALERLGAPAYKIASFELVDLPLIRYAAKTGKPLILSTGMASDREIDDAAFVTTGAERLFLHCVSGYPTLIDESALCRTEDLERAFGLWGLSDHTIGIELPVAATARRCVMIEKHLTLDWNRETPDYEFSSDPSELGAMVTAVHNIWRAMRANHSAQAQDVHRPLRRSLYVVADVQAGEPFTHENVRSIRPGYGLHPDFIGQVIGRRAAADIKRGTALKWNLVAGR